jgi:DOPA 4,5-dioxygenase
MLDTKNILYHFHIYFDEKTKNKAIELRNAFIAFKELTHLDDINLFVGLVHEQPIGPHTKPMFLIACSSLLNFVLSNLIIHRDGLSILVHPNTDSEALDHTERAIWLGDKVPLDLTKL